MMYPLEQVLTEKHRVIVQLNKSLTQDNARHTIFHAPIRVEKSDPFVAQDYNILLINNGNQTTDPIKLHFDCVCNGFEERTRSEIGLMMDQLFLYQHNCCMVRCTIYRENSVALLNHLLLTEINKRLQKNHFTMQYIKCEFYDVRKLNVVNMLGHGNIEKKFQGPMDLQKWINSEYQHLIAGCQGNECLDFEFSFSDRTHRTYCVKFSYMHVVVSKLDSEGKASLCNCFKNVNKRYGARGTNCLLVDTLRDYLDDRNNMKLWLFLGLPVKRPVTSLVEDMIKIACAASSGFSVKSNRTLEKEPSHTVIDEPTLTEEMTKTEEKSAKTSKKAKSKSKSPPSSFQSFSNRLSFWYNKIDDQYGNVVRSLEAYYDMKYNARIRHLCGELHDMITHDEFQPNTTEPTPKSIQTNSRKSNLDLHKNESSWSIEMLRNHLVDYRNAASDFSLMIDEITQSKYEPLKVYLRTKNYDLTRFSIQYKIKKLQDIQNEITRTINEEKNAFLKKLQNRT